MQQAEKEALNSHCESPHDKSVTDTVLLSHYNELHIMPTYMSK